MSLVLFCSSGALGSILVINTNGGGHSTGVHEWIAIDDEACDSPGVTGIDWGQPCKAEHLAGLESPPARKPQGNSRRSPSFLAVRNKVQAGTLEAVHTADLINK